MTYEVIFSDKALRQLKKMEKPVQRLIIAALERIRIRPERYVTKLVGNPGYKMRAGDYRLIIDIDNNGLNILICHRKNIYDSVQY